MRRSRVHGSSDAPEESAEKLLEVILDEVIQTASMPFDEWQKLWTSPFIPMAIPAGQDREYQCTQTAVDAAHKLTSQTWKQRADLRQTISRSAFDRLSFTAIGQTITLSPTHLPPGQQTGTPDRAFYAAMAADYAASLDVAATKARPDYDRHIPCHLFDVSQGVAPFAVGPVRFLPRVEWIRTYVTDPTVFRLVDRIERGTLSPTGLSKRALTPGATQEVLAARDIISFLGNFPWIATIRVRGHEPNQSHHKAAVIVGLATDLIGLRFHLEDARRFARAGQRHLLNEARLATDMNGRFLRGWTSQRPGIGGRPGAVAAKMRAEQPFFDAAGQALEAYVVGRNSGKAPHLVERWANAVYWFGEARREASDFMAVVDYGCAADGLSGAGGDARVLTEFANAALNPKSSATPTGGISIPDAVTRIYREGRNKLAHGEEPGLFEDQSETRRLGDELVSLLLNEITAELAEILTNRPALLTVSEQHAYRALVTRLKNRP